MNIRQVLDKIDDGQLFVPAFQREYVWKRQNAKDLMNSLIRRYPTGTLLTWETRQPPELKGPISYNENMGAVKLILDGQQRITTFYLLMRGKIPPYYTERDIKSYILDLYINVSTLELEYFKPKYMANDPLWQKLTDIFTNKIKAMDVRRRLKESGLLTDELENKIDNNFELIKSVETREFVEQQIPISASIKEAIDIFYIVNDSGVNLTDAELALAQISGYWPQARSLFKEKLNELADRGFVFNLDFIVYVLLGTLYNMGSDLRKLHSSSNNDTIRTAWEKLSANTLDYVMNIMQEHAYIDHTKEINSVYALIPILVYTYNKADRVLTQKEIDKAVKWFYYSQIRQRYISQLQQKLDKDLGIVAKSEKPFDELLSLIKLERPLEITPDEIVGTGISHPLFNMMKILFKSRNAKCLGTGVGLRRNMGRKYTIEYDHIFAYSILRDAGYNPNNRKKYALAQEITNRCLLTQVENRSKSASYATTYLAQVKANYPDALKLQLIPEDESLWLLDKYDDFLKERRKMLAGEINKFLSEIVRTEEAAITLGIDDLLERGETDYLEAKSTFQIDTKHNIISEEYKDAIYRAIAGFANADGGTVLIGVSKEGDILGLEDDYNIFGGNVNLFKENLKECITSCFKDTKANNLISIKYHNFDGLEICQIDISKSDEPVFIILKEKYGISKEVFCIRNGNNSEELSKDRSISYIRQRFEVFK